MASDLLAKPDIQALVAEHEDAAARRLAVTKERIIAELEGAIELARQKGDATAMIRGWAEIGKMIGAYAPERRKIELSADADAIQAQFARMSDQELIDLIAEESAP